MSSILSRRQSAQPVLSLFFLLILLLSFIYLRTHFITQASLSEHLSNKFGGQVTDQLIKDAILHSTQKLALELDIDLENIDITLEDYKALIDEADEKFGRCQQYRLVVLKPGRFPCYTCTILQDVLLSPGQTFKIGQTCGNEKSRYGSNLPEAGLKYFLEFEGNAFEVLVAEYVRLKLFQYSKERQMILEANQLTESEMVLPPGNKITR